MNVILPPRVFYGICFYLLIIEWSKEPMFISEVISFGSIFVLIVPRTDVSII